MTKISILVPCCNVEKYIRECLDSIKAQTFTNIEVICIDDGSTDNTGNIIEEYVAKDSRFKVIHKKNSGYGDSMNKGLEECTGDYIGIVESDDWIEPDMYKTLLKTCIDNDLDFVKCLWESGPTGTEYFDKMEWIPSNKVYAPLKKQTVMLMQPSIWAALYKRDLIEKGRKIRFLPTPGASYQDTAFAFKAYTKAKRFMLLNKVLHHYRINPNSSVLSSGKATCIIDEWNEMRRWINDDSELKDTIIRSKTFLRILHGGFIWNYNRLSILQRLMFLKAANRFFKTMKEEGLFNIGNIDDPSAKADLESALQDPLSFHDAQMKATVNSLFCHTSISHSTTAPEELISVIVTCYNTEKYISSSLESIRRQDYKNIEIICIDDCSTDSTAVLVKHIMRHDTRLKFASTKTNSGPSASRNLGLNLCNGKYVMFVDGDDCLLPNAITTLYNAMQDDVDVVMGTVDVRYEGGKEIYGDLPRSDKGYYTVKENRKIDINTDYLDYLNTNVSACGKLWKRSVIKDNDIVFPVGLLYEDANFFWKYLCAAPRLCMITSPIYYYLRHTTGSIMSSTFNKKPGLAIQHLYILRDLYEFICKHNLQTAGRKILNNVYEPYFWFAYNNSPQCDHDKVLTTICEILHEQNADTSNNRLLEYLKRYKTVQKSEIFMKQYNIDITLEKKSFWKTFLRNIKHK